MDISIRELKANPARAIALMQQGEPVRITSHRKVVAELVAPGTAQALANAAAPAPRPISPEDAAAMARLMASGVIAEPATLPYQLPVLVAWPPSPDGQSLSDLVIEGRGPR